MARALTCARWAGQITRSHNISRRHHHSPRYPGTSTRVALSVPMKTRPQMQSCAPRDRKVCNFRFILLSRNFFFFFPYRNLTKPTISSVCGIEKVQLPDSDEWNLVGIIPVSGDAKHPGTSNVTSTATGLQLELAGGAWGDLTDLRAVIDFVCDHDDDKESTLEFANFDFKTLRLSWTSRHACSKSAPGTPPEKAPSSPTPTDPAPSEPDPTTPDNSDKDVNVKGGGWGFFTWVFVLGLLGCVAYVGLHAWRNYKRYGTVTPANARSSEFLRDIPFLLRDFVRKVAGTFSAGTSTGYTSV